MKAIALTCLNQIVDSGAKRDREGWRKYGERLLKGTVEQRVGFQVVVAFFDNERGTYYRMNFAAMPRLESQKKHKKGFMV